MIGRVVSIKMQNTAVVLVESQKIHPIYKKTFKWSKKYSVHDLSNVKLGDIVEIVKIRPISKTKHWQITKVLGTDVVALGEEALKEVAAEAIAEVLPEEEAAEEPKVESEVEVEKSAEAVEKPKQTRKKKGEN